MQRMRADEMMASLALQRSLAEGSSTDRFLLEKRAAAARDLATKRAAVAAALTPLATKATVATNAAAARTATSRTTKLTSNPTPTPTPTPARTPTPPAPTPTLPPVTGALPPHWEVVPSTRVSKKYYWNTLTDVTQYERPASLPPAPAAAAPKPNPYAARPAAAGAQQSAGSGGVQHGQQVQTHGGSKTVSRVDDASLSMIIEMGFDLASARRALLQFGGNVPAAIDALMDGTVGDPTPTPAPAAVVAPTLARPTPARTFKDGARTFKENPAMPATLDELNRRLAATAAAAAAPPMQRTYAMPPPQQLQQPTLTPAQSRAARRGVPPPEADATLAPTRSGGPTQKLRCEVCNLQFTGPVPYEEHITAKKHLANMAAQAKKLRAAPPRQSHAQSQSLHPVQTHDQSQLPRAQSLAHVPPVRAPIRASTRAPEIDDLLAMMDSFTAPVAAQRANGVAPGQLPRQQGGAGGVGSTIGSDPIRGHNDYGSGPAAAAPNTSTTGGKRAVQCRHWAKNGACPQMKRGKTCHFAHGDADAGTAPSVSRAALAASRAAPAAVAARGPPVAARGAPPPAAALYAPVVTTAPVAAPYAGAGEGAPAVHEECCVCLDAKRGSVLVPCGHTNMCMPCAKQVLASASPRCPLCCQFVSQAFPAHI